MWHLITSTRARNRATSKLTLIYCGRSSTTYIIIIKKKINGMSINKHVVVPSPAHWLAYTCAGRRDWWILHAVFTVYTRTCALMDRVVRGSENSHDWPSIVRYRLGGPWLKFDSALFIVASFISNEWSIWDEGRSLKSR